MERDSLSLESRIVRAETKVDSVQQDIAEIKRTLRWIIGLVFSLNSTILGVVTKGFGMMS